MQVRSDQVIDSLFVLLLDVHSNECKSKKKEVFMSGFSQELFTRYKLNTYFHVAQSGRGFYKEAATGI